MRKRLILAAFLLLAALPAQASLSVVQAASVQNGANSTSAVVSITTTSGNLLVAFVRQEANTTDAFSMTDSASQSWTAVTSGKVTDAKPMEGQMFYKANSAAVTSVTGSWTTNTGSNGAMVVFEISGAATSSAEDSSVNQDNSASSTTASSGSLTTTNANDILLFAVCPSGAVTWTAGGGYTIPANGSVARAAMQYQVVSTTQSSVTTSMTMSVSHPSATTFAAFKAVSGGAAPTGMNKRQKYEQMDPQRR